MYQEINFEDVPSVVFPVHIWADGMWSPDPDRVEVAALLNGRHYLVDKKDVFKVTGQWQYFVKDFDVLTEGSFDADVDDDEEA